MTNAPLISTDELAGLLDDPRLVLLDCRFDLSDTAWGRREHALAHIPGALYVSLDEQLSGPVTAHTGRHPLPRPEDFARTVAAWHIGADSRVVAYDQGPGPYAARLWWMMRAAGYGCVQVLDGGFAAWKSGNRHVDARQRAAVPPAPARAADAHGLHADTGQVQQGLADGSILLVDARGADRFAGQNETLDPVAGHVPGAVNHPFVQNLGSDGRFLAPGELRRRWLATLAGRKPESLVAMCGSGVTACHSLLALEVAGLPGGRLYSGSFSEWIRDPRRPTER